MKHKFIIVILTFLTVVFLTSAYSQAENSQAKNGQDSIVKLGDAIIIEFQSELVTYTKENRAKKISDEFKNKVLNNQINIDNIETKNNKNGQYIIYLKDSLMTLTDKDLNGRELNNFAEEVQSQLEKYNIFTVLGNLIPSIIFYGFIFVLTFAPIMFNLTLENIKNKFIWHPKNRNRACENEQKKEGEEEAEEEEEQVWGNLNKVKKKFKCGQADFEGHKIISIYKINKNYVIYLAQGIYESGYVTYAGKQEILKRFDKFTHQIIEIYASQTKGFDNPESVNYQIAHAIYTAIRLNDSSMTNDGDDNTDRGIKVDEIIENTLKKAKQSVINYRIKKDRLEYLLSSFKTFIILIFVTILLATIPKLSQNIIIDFNIPNDILIAVLFSSLGGLLSSAIKSSNLGLIEDININQSATIRIYIAVISGILVYAMIKSNYIPDLTNILTDDIEQNSWRISVISTIAGFIEYFIPNLLTRLNNNVSDIDTNLR
ncbi:MAG: hypothetical protein QNJ32_07940 [Xenococcaceae cyanobacterium MO_167.B27]|nr:hypothetical protein [Xenococcaceae cyanobacterium MO_167.B27]